jgi:signal transduction histidine kinase
MVFSRLSVGETIRNAPFKFRTKSGEAKYLTVDSNVSFHPDGTFKHTRCFIRDDNERLVRETINSMNLKQLKVSAQAKDRFIRRIFHEMRTPMHSVWSTLENGLGSNENIELSYQVIKHEYIYWL